MKLHLSLTVLPVWLCVALLGGVSGCEEPLPGERSDGAMRITAGSGSEQNPCLSPDGRSLVFTRFSNGYNEGPAALMLLDLESGSERVLVDDGDHDNVNLPGQCFSPDGSRLVYSSDASDRDEIWILDLETDLRSQVTNHPGTQAFEPAFTHDGERVTFELIENGRSGRILSVALDGTDERSLTDGTFDDRQPNPSPRSEQVLFQSARGGTWGLWTVALSGGEPALLFDSAAEETDASWSPDGEAVVFATDDCGAISCAATLSGGEVSITSTPSGWYEGAPALAADGTIYVEAADDDPEERGRTAIYRLP